MVGILRKPLVWLRNNVFFPVSVPLIICRKYGTHALPIVSMLLRKTPNFSSGYFLGVFDIYPILELAEKGYAEKHIQRAFREIRIDSYHLASLAIYCDSQKRPREALQLFITFLNHTSFSMGDILDLIEDYHYGKIDVLIAAMHLTDKEHLWPANIDRSDLSRFLKIQSYFLPTYMKGLAHLRPRIIDQRSCFANQEYNRLANFRLFELKTLTLGSIEGEHPFREACSLKNAGIFVLLSELLMANKGSSPVTRDEIALSLGHLGGIDDRLISELEVLSLDHGSLALFYALRAFFDSGIEAHLSASVSQRLSPLIERLVAIMESIMQLVLEVHCDDEDQKQDAIKVIHEGLRGAISLCISHSDLEMISHLAHIANKYPRSVQRIFMDAGVSAKQLGGLNALDRRESLAMDLGI